MCRIYQRNKSLRRVWKTEDPSVEPAAHIIWIPRRVLSGVLLDQGGHCRVETRQLRSQLSYGTDRVEQTGRTLISYHSNTQQESMRVWLAGPGRDSGRCRVVGEGRGTLVWSELPRAQHRVSHLAASQPSYPYFARLARPLICANQSGEYADNHIHIQRYHTPAKTRLSNQAFHVFWLAWVSRHQVNTTLHNHTTTSQPSQQSWTNFSITAMIWPDNPKLWVLWCYCDSHANSIIWPTCLEESKPSLWDSMRRTNFPQVS